MKYKNLKRLRESIGLNQEEFARTLSLGKTTYNGYETGARDPKSDFWIAVAEKYNVTIDYLMGFSDDPTTRATTFVASKPISAVEREILNKYHALDEHGEKAVTAILDIEYARCINTVHEAADDLPDNIITLRISESTACAGSVGAYLGQDAFRSVRVRDDGLVGRADFAVKVSGDSMEPEFYDEDYVLIEQTYDVEPDDIALVILNDEGYIKRIGGDKYIYALNKKYAPLFVGGSSDYRVVGKVIGKLDESLIIE